MESKSNQYQQQVRRHYQYSDCAMPRENESMRKEHLSQNNHLPNHQSDERQMNLGDDHQSSEALLGTFCKTQ